MLSISTLLHQKDTVNSTFSAFFDLAEAALSGANMTFQYWLAYASTIAKNPGFIMTDFFKPYFDRALPQSDIECSYYLKSEPFLNSLNRHIKSVANSYSKNAIFKSMTDTYLYLDKYLSEVRASLLPVQETPHEVIRQMDDVAVFRYQNKIAAKMKFATPLLIVYAPVNRYHIMDIRPGRSIVEHFVSAGFDVFLLDWGKQRNNRPSISGYASYLGEAISQIKKISGSSQVSILGYSWGGVMSMIYSSLRPNDVRNLILQSAHVDFDQDSSILASWFRNLPLSEIAQKFEFVDCRFINLALMMRNPAIHTLDAFRFAFDMNIESMAPTNFGLDALRIVEWLDDTPLFPIGFFLDYIGKLYQQNLLIKQKLKINLSKDGAEETVNLAMIKMPLLNIIGSLDDICTPAAALPIIDKADSKDKETFWFPTGHIELSVGSEAHRELWPKVVEWLKQRSN